ELIQRAFQALLHEKGFRDITVQEIAERATVNRVTFYAHFPDKYALLEDTMHSLFEQRLRAALPEDSRATLENVARLIELAGDTLSEFAARCPPPRGQFDAFLEKQVMAGVNAVLRGWLPGPARGRASTHPTPDESATIATWAIYGAAVAWSQNDRRVPAA